MPHNELADGPDWYLSVELIHDPGLEVIWVHELAAGTEVIGVQARAHNGRNLSRSVHCVNVHPETFREGFTVSDHRRKKCIPNGIGAVIGRLRLIAQEVSHRGEYVSRRHSKLLRIVPEGVRGVPSSDTQRGVALQRAIHDARPASVE